MEMEHLQLHCSAEFTPLCVHPALDQPSESADHFMPYGYAQKPRVP